MFKAFENYYYQLAEKNVKVIEKNSEISQVASSSITTIVKDSSGVIFRVQIEAWDQKKDKSYSLFKGYEVYEYQQDNLFKYCIGNFSNNQLAKNYKVELIKKGFQNVFLAAFLGGSGSCSFFTAALGLSAPSLRRTGLSPQISSKW